MNCNYIPPPISQLSHDKPKGVDFVKEIESMGFELPLGAVMHLWDGRYESVTINEERNVLELKIFGYDNLVIHKTNA